MMQWEVLSKTDAVQIVSSWQEMDKKSFAEMADNWSDLLISGLNDNYRKIREELINAYSKAKGSINENSSSKDKYLLDLQFGIELYKILNTYGLSPRTASNDQVWIYLGVKVVPDIITNRYPGTKTKDSDTEYWRNVNEDRLYKKRWNEINILYWCWQLRNIQLF